MPRMIVYIDPRCYGIGLHATIDVPYLSIDAVNDFIRRFMESEAMFHSGVPLTYSHDEIERWGIESNAILEPDKWQEDCSGATTNLKE